MTSDLMTLPRAYSSLCSTQCRLPVLSCHVFRLTHRLLQQFIATELTKLCATLTTLLLGAVVHTSCHTTNS